MTIVTYSVSGDFSNGLDIVQFLSEVKNNATITKTLKSTRKKGDSFKLNFQGNLTAGETTELNNIVANHVPDGTVLLNTTSVFRTISPTTADDHLSRFPRGTVWANTNTDNVYFSTDDATGAAVWKNLTLGPTGSTGPTGPTGFNGTTGSFGPTGPTGPEGGPPGPTGSTGVSAEYWILVDQQATGTDGGTFTSGAWQTRTVNAVQYSDGASVSLSSNQITLNTGKYLISAYAPAHRVDKHQIRLRNITGSITEAIGTSADSPNSGNASTSVSLLTHVVNPGSSTVYEIQHYATVTRNNDGFGIANGITNEIYTAITITKNL